jgi:glyoxylase-like metal-dependent hydrolase (beta-lactamase superfamily II)
MVLAQAGGPRQAVEKAAAALGGLDRIQKLKNIRLVGYGQYAYMFGGGNITGDPNAPMKFEAANALERVYDFEHDRYQQLERRNYLFPFAIANGHDYHLNDQRLDGDIPYDILPTGGGPRRVYSWFEDAHNVDGTHVRRMWSIVNPIAAIRAALDPGSRLSQGGAEPGVNVVNVVLKQGDKFSLAMSSTTNLPAWVRWTNPQKNLGEITMTTHYTGYTPHESFLLPLGYTTNMDWRNVPYIKIYVDKYVFDGPVPDLSAPAIVRAAADPAPATDIHATPIAKGIWRLNSGTTVFEFDDHLTLFELLQGVRPAQATLDFAQKMVPGKPVTQLIVSHNHFDHANGIRPAVAEGLTIISRRGNEGILREQVEHPSPDFPDSLASHPKPMSFLPVDEHLRLSDKSMTVDVYWTRGSIHTADSVFAYAPAQKVMAEGDMATAAFDYQFWPDTYLDSVEYYKLDVDFLSPVHAVWQPDVLPRAKVLQLIQDGVARARALCAAQLEKGNYFPGCPVQSKRY